MINEQFDAVGFYPADILVPKAADMTRWAVVACDQFTSQPEYWKSLEETVGDAPSALRLILPEAYLAKADVAERIAAIHSSMESYLDGGVFRTLPASMIYVRRTQSNGRVRQGVVGMVDLERYDFTPGSGALIRATEGTVLSRIPPRMAVRRDAPLELPHVMLLIDDPDHTVIEPLADGDDMEQVYDFDLIQGGGHLTGWRLTEAQMDAVARALGDLCTPETMEERYGRRFDAPMLFAVGDGNHSLAAAKACYEEKKAAAPAGAVLPERYALVEVVNCHDAALEFEPIHRCLFGVEPEAVLSALRAYYPDVHDGAGEGHTFSFVWTGGSGEITVPHPAAQLAVGTLQTFLDDYLEAHPGRLDYIHGEETARHLGREPGNLAFCLPVIGKEQLFPTVMADGVLPRKAFSMGDARDKRYYVEARRLH